MSLPIPADFAAIAAIAGGLTLLLAVQAIVIRYHKRRESREATAARERDEAWRQLWDAIKDGK